MLKAVLITIGNQIFHQILLYDIFNWKSVRRVFFDKLKTKFNLPNVYSKSFFVEINLYKKKWLINSSYHLHKSDIGNYIHIISKSLETCSAKCEYIVILCDINACVEDETLDTFCKSYSLNSLNKQRTCFKNPKNPSCIHLILTQKPRSFQTKRFIDTGLLSQNDHPF